MYLLKLDSTLNYELEQYCLLSQYNEVFEKTKN